MQYWVLYQAGVGGDGFGCMLEHATNVQPADGELKWRIHYRDQRYGILDRPIKFYQAHWATPFPFRSRELPNNVVLNPTYLELVEQKINTVITAHTVYFNQIKKFEHRNVVETDQIKIHLYSKNTERVYRDLLAKTPKAAKTFDAEQHCIRTNCDLENTGYNIHIDIERIRQDWDYTNQCMSELGIDLPRDVYDQYLFYID